MMILCDWIVLYFFLGLDLNRFSTVGNTDMMYDLYGVANHIGGLMAGHYTAFVKFFNTIFILGKTSPFYSS